MMLKTVSRAFSKCAAALFCIAFLVVATTFSAYADSSLANFKQETGSTPYVIPPNNCYETLYILSKTKATTMKCLAPGKMINGRKVLVTFSRKIPNTNTQSCYLPSSHFAIKSNANGAVCFGGSGYLGIRLDGVYNISSQLLTTSSGHVKYYKGGPGNYFYWDWWTTYGCSPFCGNGTEITQVYID